MQLMKAYVAKTSCNQLIDSATSLLTIYSNNVAMSLYNIIICTAPTACIEHVCVCSSTYPLFSQTVVCLKCLSINFVFTEVNNELCQSFSPLIESSLYPKKQKAQSSVYSIVMESFLSSVPMGIVKYTYISLNSKLWLSSELDGYQRVNQRILYANLHSEITELVMVYCVYYAT